MDWPAPSRVREANGRPGPDYWQQRADYDIVATLDTTRHTIKGHVSLAYTNNSPDTLRYVWMQLDQNLYKPGSAGSYLFPRRHAIRRSRIRGRLRDPESRRRTARVRRRR